MRYFIIALVVCLVTLTAFVPGCAKKPATNNTVVSGQEGMPLPGSKTPGSGPKLDTDPSKAPSFNEIIQDQIGVPIYPGAKNQKDFSSGVDSDKNKQMMVSFTTTDSFDKVMAYYRKELKGYTEAPRKNLKGSTLGGFYHKAGQYRELIVIEKPAKGPIKIAMTVTKPAKAQIGVE